MVNKSGAYGANDTAVEESGAYNSNDTPVDATGTPPKPADTGGTASDLGKSLKVGVQKLPGMVTGIADLPFALATGARPFTKAADVLGDVTGFQPGKWADQTKFSAGYEESKKAVDEAWDKGSLSDIAGSAANIAGAYVKNPAYTLNQVAESVPSMVAGGVASKALLGAGSVAGAAVDAATGVAARAAVPGTLVRTVGEKWAVPVAAGIGEGAVTAGQQMAQYTGDNQQKNALASLGAGAGTALIGVGAGRLANKMGLETAETAMAKIGTGASAEVPMSMKRRVLGGMVSEAVLQELPQSAQEQMWQNFADGKPLMDGVGRAATEGALASGVMGASANIPGGRRPAPVVDPVNTTSSASETPDANGLALAPRDAPAPKPSEAMGLNPATGPLSAAAVQAVDSGAYMPPAGQATPVEPEPNSVVLQNRDRTNQASIAQMQDIAARPDYLRAGQSRDMASGAPVVFGSLPPTALMGKPETVVDGRGERVSTQYAVVDAGDLLASHNADGTPVAEYAQGLPGKLRAIAGNGRTAGLQAAYQLGTTDSYRQELTNDAVALGVDPQAIAAMQRPVLVRVMGAADVTDDMGDRTNIPMTQNLSAKDMAANDARRIDVRSMSFDEDGAPTPDSIKDFISQIPSAEQGNLLGSDKMPTRQAIERFQAATFKEAYQLDGLVELYTQATDPDARAALRAAADASGVMANLRGTGEFDLSDSVASAISLAVNAKRQGLSLQDAGNNQDININPDAYPVLNFLAANIQSPKRMAEGLRRWGKLALDQARIADENTRQGNLLGPAPTLTRQEIFARLGSDLNPTNQAIAPPAPAAPVQMQRYVDEANTRIEAGRTKIKDLQQNQAPAQAQKAPAAIDSVAGRALAVQPLPPAIQALIDNGQPLNRVQAGAVQRRAQKVTNEPHSVIALPGGGFAVQPGAADVTDVEVKPVVQARLPAPQETTTQQPQGQDAQTPQALPPKAKPEAAAAPVAGAASEVAPATQKALERIAKGMAYFSTGIKAAQFINQNGLKDTHEVVRHESGANRYDVRAKKAVQPAAELTAPAKQAQQTSVDALDSIGIVEYGGSRYVELHGASEAVYKKYGATLKIGDISTGNAWLIGMNEYLQNAKTLKKYAVTVEQNLKKNRMRAIFDGVIDAAARSADGRPALSAPTKQDVLAQQERQDNAKALDQRTQIDREREAADQQQGGFLRAMAAPEQRSDNTGDIFGGVSAADVQDAASQAIKKRAERAAAADKTGLFSESNAAPAQATQAQAAIENVALEPDAPAFSRQRARGASITLKAAPLARSVLDGVIARITAHWQRDAQAAVTVVDRFDDLPAQILAAAAQQGYDNASTDERVSGVAYKGHIYLVHENISSELQAEETLWHERLHWALRGQPGQSAKALRVAMQQLYMRIGGGTGLVNMAHEAGVDLRGLRKQAANTPMALRSALAMEEFLAEVEGRLAYEHLPHKAKRWFGEFVGALRQWLRAQGFAKMAQRLGANLEAGTLDDVRYLLRVLRGPGGAGVGDASVRFSFAGQRAVTADTHALATAQQRIEAGEDAEAVRQATGWSQGADKKWRFEISDADARLKSSSNGRVLSGIKGGYGSLPLESVLDHPALYAAYPDLRDMRVRFADLAGTDAQINLQTSVIEIGSHLDPDALNGEVLSSLLHEIQHGIQYVEGFASGGTPAGMSRKAKAEQRRLEEKMERYDRSAQADAELWLAKYPEKVAEATAYLQSEGLLEAGDIATRDDIGFAITAQDRLYQDWLKQWRESKETARLSAFDGYKRLAGEVEARNTQTRQGMTDAQRGATSPSQTADVPASDVIVTFNGKEARNVPAPANAPEGQAESFVQAPDGSIDFGEITPEMGKAMRRQAGKIRLQQGAQNANGTGYGLAHIEARHGREIAASGYASVQHFVKDGLSRVDQVWKPGKTSQLIAVHAGKNGKVFFLELSAAKDEAGDFYAVNSAFPANDKYVARKERNEGWKPLWSRYPVPADASGASGFVGQSPNAGETTPTVSSQGGERSVEDRGETGKPDRPVKFKRSASTPEQARATQAVERIVAGLKAKWANAPEVVVAYGMQDPSIPKEARLADLQQRQGGATGSPEGFYYGGKVYVLASQVSSPREVARVLMHEALGHAGLQGVFGKALTPILQQLATLRRADVAAKAKAYGLDIADPAQRLQAAEEVLAEMAEKNPQLGFVKRAVAAIRNWLRANMPGFKSLAMTDADIVQAYLLPARGWIERGKGPASNRSLGFSRSELPKSQPFASRLAAIVAGKKEDATAIQDDNGTWLLAPRAESYTEQERRDAQQRIDRLNPALDRANAERAQVLRDTPSGSMVIGSRIARLFGYGVTFIEQNKDFEGVSLGGQAFVSPSTQHAEIGLIGHEVYHSFKRLNPKLAEALAQQIRPYLKDGVVDAARQREDRNGGTNTSQAKAEEEVLADLNGAMWLDPLFWREMATNDPSLFRQVAYRFMQAATKALQSLSRFKADTLVTDVDTVRKLIAQEWALQAQEQGNTSEFTQHAPDEGATPMFSRTAAVIDSSMGAMNAAQSKWAAPLPSTFDDVVYKLQDKLIDTKRVIEAITGHAGKIKDALDVYLQEELFHGRTAKRVADFGSMELKPVLNQMRMMGISLDDMEEFLHARHAKEANALIAGRDPAMPDGGSGMTNQAAADYMTRLPPDQRRKLEIAATKIDAIITATRQLYADYGLEDQKTVDGWGEMFKSYVPLMREGKDEGMGIGQGFTVKGKEVKGRTGSSRKVVDILSNIAAQREKVIVRGEKNRVATALVGLAQANPNAEFWTVLAHTPTERVYDAKSDKVIDRPDSMFKQRDNVVTTKVMSKKGFVVEKAVVFSEDDPRAMRMAAALKNLDSGQLEGLLGASAKITRYFSAVNTQYNPVFGVVNLVRDVQGTMVNLGSTPLAHRRTKIGKDTLSALAGVYKDVRAVRDGKVASSKWSKLWSQMQEDGGTTGYRELFSTSADRANELKSIINPDAWADSKWGKVFTANGALKVPVGIAKQKAGALFDWLSDYNEAMENGVRLAAYSAALDEGMTREQAASLSKNLTVNFNRKGQVGQQAGAVYAFFNAAMQGTARIGQVLFDMDGGNIKTLRLSKTGKSVVAGGITLGIVQALMLAAAGFDDEDPPEFLRERSFIIPTGGKSYVSIPMPLGLHVIPGIGRHATEFAMSGFKDPAKRTLSVIGMMADAFNPIGNAGLSMQTLAPTALDPLVALTENKDWTGKPIARVSHNRAIPGHSQWKDTATAPAKLIAEAINWMSGGDKYVAGALSPTPDQIDYLFAQVTGGVGRELSKVEQVARTAISGEELPTYKMPLVGRFYGNSSGQASEGSAFYANVNKLNEIETKAKSMRKDGKGAEASEYLRSQPDAVLIFQANAAERQIQKLKHAKRKLIEKDAPREEVKAKEEQITAVMARLNRAAEARRASGLTSQAN